jgi:hypothetical protein
MQTQGAENLKKKTVRILEYEPYKIGCEKRGKIQNY